MSDIWYLDVRRRFECSWTGTTGKLFLTCTSFKENSVSKLTQTAGKTASSGQSIPEYQVIGDEWFLETLNGVLKAYGAYRWSYVTEEGNLTGRETISKLKYKAFS